MTREEAEAALRAWATVQRDELVQAAHQAGVSKNRIHVLTGIARTTIDRIMEAPMGTTKQALAGYLTVYASQWPRPLEGFGYNYGWAAQQPAPVSSSHTAVEVANELLGDAEFQALRLGTWLNTPDGQLLAEAASMITPPPYREDLDLLVEALQLAAKEQQAEARRRIAAGVAIGGVIALAIGASGR